MGMDIGAVGRVAEPFVRSWNSHDALLYALSVGAGQDDPARELQFTTENSTGVTQQIIPSLAVPIVQAGLARVLPFGDYPRSALVHAEQTFTVHRVMRVQESLAVSARVASISDKGSGALVHIEVDAADEATGEPVVSSRLGYFIRGQGGFGGSHGHLDDVSWVEPKGAPDRTVSVRTRPDAALLYRLTGDHNPLHSDPEVARAAGFPRPILHGLATYGITTRVLINELLDGDPTRIGSVSARFTAPVIPGDTLVLHLWQTDDGAVFRVLKDRDTPVLERGRLTATSPEGRHAKLMTTGI